MQYNFLQRKLGPHNVRGAEMKPRARLDLDPRLLDNALDVAIPPAAWDMPNSIQTAFGSRLRV